MPDADFCSAIRSPYGGLSRPCDTEQISWGKLSRLPCTIAESTLRTLMDTDFAVRCPLVRGWRLISGSCPSTRTFDPCFLRTPSRDGSPCIITRPSPPSGWPEDFHLQAAEHAQHTTNPLRGGRFACVPWDRFSSRSATLFGDNGLAMPSRRFNKAALQSAFRRIQGETAIQIPYIRLQGARPPQAPAASF
jgi:hypothetical protein